MIIVIINKNLDNFSFYVICKIFKIKLIYLIKRYLYSLLLVILLYPHTFSQSYTINGYVEDVNTGEKLLGANVYDINTLKGTVTNNYGFYSLTLTKGPVSLIVSFVGSPQKQIDLNLRNDTTINFPIKTGLQLEEVKIVGTRFGSKIENTQLGLNQIPIKTIKNMPVLLSEVDVIKAFQLMPGVQSGNEGSSGLYVRGGGPDQNLILLDGVPVYNVNHLFGFFSVFNADAIQNVSLIKGGFPARYGGRLSSVLDIRMKEGNNKEFKGEGSIGLISSRLTMEGPIITDKTSFIVSGRRTYYDILAWPVLKIVQKVEDLDRLSAGYYFYDLNAKINHKFSNRSRLFLSSYMGKDKAYIKYKDEYEDYFDEEKIKLWWGNITTALRWNYMISNKLFSNTTVTYSRYKFLIGEEWNYKYSEEEKSEEYSFDYHSGIEDFTVKLDFDFFPGPNHNIKFGSSFIYHTFRPGVTTEKYIEGNDTETYNFGNKNIYAGEIDGYAEDEIKIGRLIKTNLGLHYSAFYVQDNFYQSLQPRISGRFLINDRWSVKAAYSEMRQYIHLLTNSTVSLPTDLWLPVTKRIKPLKSVQYSVGTIYGITDKIDLSVEGFYKNLDNLIEYKEGASFYSTNNLWEDQIETGRGWSYGMELLIEKKTGKTSGWIGYTLSWAERQFDNISFGKKFPYKYDRRHDISIVLIHKFNERIDGGLTWVYGTGTATTMASQTYIPLTPYYNIDYLHESIEYIENRNNYRMPAYHRLDLAINFRKEKKRINRTWTIGIYNAYCRQNPFFLYIRPDWDSYNYEESKQYLYQVSLFPLIFSLSYGFTF